VSNNDTKKHRLCLVTIQNAQPAMLWRVDGDGYYSMNSPLYEGRYLIIGSSGSNTIDMWNVQTRRLEKQFTRESQLGFCKCAVMALNETYLIGRDKCTFAMS
jgi:WD40 repeat protein